MLIYVCEVFYYVKNERNWSEIVILLVFYWIKEE